MIYERERERERKREGEREGEGKVQSLQERYMYRERIDFLGPLLWDTIHKYTSNKDYWFPVKNTKIKDKIFYICIALIAHKQRKPTK